jgi:hypothetical protein
MIRSVSISIAAFTAATASAVTFGPGPVAAAPCGIDIHASEVVTAANNLQPPPGLDASWTPTPYGGNYNPCATLSTALIRPQKIDPAAPGLALMFHRGEYVGTAPLTPSNYLYFNITRSSDDTVALDYKGDDCNVAVHPGAYCFAPVDTFRYQWQGDHLHVI